VGVMVVAVPSQIACSTQAEARVRDWQHSGEAASGVRHSLAAAEKGDQGCRARSSTRGYIELRAQKTPCKRLT